MFIERICGPFSANTIIPDIGRSSIIIGGHRTWGQSRRLRCFKERGMQCIACGIIGNVFYLERRKPNDSPSLNLYASKAHCDILMTYTNIVTLTNGTPSKDYQTICMPCNEAQHKLISNL